MTDTQSMQVASGWKLVPIEPTDAMLAAPGFVTSSLLDEDDCRTAWSAMLSASPPPPQASDVSIPAGMKPWAGGEESVGGPLDYDGGTVMFRDGSVETGNAEYPWNWSSGCGAGTIIAYTPKPQPQASNSDALREAAAFLLWQHDRRGPVMDSTEAWERLRSALATQSTPAADKPGDVERLREALEPFARQNPHKHEPGSNGILVPATVSDIRRARAALAETTNAADSGASAR